jgi:hypothetical protein
MQRGEYWRLRDSSGKPPGVMGWWPSRSVTFLENHDTVNQPPTYHACYTLLQGHFHGDFGLLTSF